MRRAFAALLLALVAVVLSACRADYRVGDKVWVEWDGADYPAYVLEVRGDARFRIHFDGYEARWDQEVGVERIHGRIDGPVTTVPDPPARVARAMGLLRPASSAGTVSPFRAGDRLNVRWRGSVYAATIVEVRGSDSYLVHYEGHESAWDELIDRDRIVLQ